MTDKVTTAKRSENMRRIKSKGTHPEMLVRKLLHKMGYRYRIHRKNLPGSPDIVFGGRRKVIFVHGCFWHCHDTDGCADSRTPKSNTGYWVPKLARNKERDARNLAALAETGWQSLVIWDCETRDAAELRSRLVAFLDP